MPRSLLAPDPPMNAALRELPAADPLLAILERQRAAHRAHVPDHAERLADLARLRAAVLRRAEGLADAMAADVCRRSRHESLLTDTWTVLAEIDHTRRALRGWMRPKRQRADWLFFPARTEVRYQPLGVVGIIAPWNYPVNLALMPLVAAIAAGNQVMLKPSEHTPRTSALLAELLDEVFPRDRVATVLGDAQVARDFAALPFDHLFFTGSTEVGRQVMAAAARNLVPVTLELGGKSPAIVAPGYPLATAAARLAAGKFLNAGQTCIAPDYVLVGKAQLEPLVDALLAELRTRYPDPATTADYTAVVNPRQHERLVRAIEDARARGARVLEAGAGDPARRVIAPTLVIGAPDDAALMRDEIFGPVLPIVAVDSVDAAIDYVNARPRPLALYHFDHDPARTERVLARTISGGASVNDTVMHIVQSHLPFGGIGPSGMGHYHGREGFLTFSKQRPVLYQARWTGMALFKPPYGKVADFLLKFLLR